MNTEATVMVETMLKFFSIQRDILNNKNKAASLLLSEIKTKYSLGPEFDQAILDCIPKTVVKE